MLNHMKRRMEEDGTLSKARKPDSTDEAHLQPDAATSRADSKHGFEDFDLAPRKEQLAIDVRPSLKHNEKIKEGALDVGLTGYAPRRASMGTGVITVKSLHVPACHKLAAFLSDPKNRSPEGYLMIKQKPFPGYDQYNRVHGMFDSMLQAVQTTQVQGKESIAFALTGLPPLGELFVMVLQQLRVPVHTLRNMSPAERQTAFHTSFFPLCRAIHFLRQDRHANALFKWHDDLKDLKGLRPAVSEQMVTAIVQLNDGDTAMRLYDFEPHKFSQAGNCVLFNGAAVHESVPLKDPGDRVVFKVAFFLDAPHTSVKPRNLKRT